MKLVWSAILILALQGCAIHQTPYVVYPDQSASLANTAVLVAHVYNSDDGKTRDGAFKSSGIDEVDGVSLSCLNACPVWARVPAGEHTFLIKYMDSVQGTMSSYQFKFAKVPIKIDMKARHTYKLSYGRSGDSVRVYVHDLGANANFGMRICGMYGDCETMYTATFD